MADFAQSTGDDDGGSVRADFSANTTSIYQGETVDFTDLSTGNSTLWCWRFEGGTPTDSNQQNPSILYNVPGTYDVTLLSGTSSDGDVETKLNYITVLAPDYEPEAIALFLRMAGLAEEPDPTRKLMINDWFVGIKNDHGLTLGISNIDTLFDAVWFMAAHAVGSSKLNWIKNAHDLTFVNSPTFTTDIGVACGAASYMNTNYNPSTQAVVYAQNSALFGIYSRTDSMVGGSDMGVVGNNGSTSYIYSRSTDGNSYDIINSATEPATATADSLALFTLERTNSTQAKLYQRGSILSTNTANSTGIPNGNFYIGSRNNVGGAVNSFTSRQYSFGCIGKGGLIQSSIYNNTQTFLTVLGADV